MTTFTTITNFASGDAATVTAKFAAAAENLRSLRNFNDHGVGLELSDDVDINNNQLTILTWDVVAHQTGSLWTPAAPTRFTAPVACKLGVIFNVEWRTSSNGERTCGMRHSVGAAEFAMESQGALVGGGNLSAMDFIPMAAGDYLEAYVYHSEGTQIGIRGDGPDRTNIRVWLMGI